MRIEQSDPRLALFADALQQYRAEYALLVDRWKTIETKAQGTATVAGVFIGGILAITGKLDANAPIAEFWLLGLVIVLLTGTILLVVRALYVRNLNDPPAGSQLQQFVVDLAQLTDDEISTRIPDVYGEQFLLWREANEDLRSSLVTKAAMVWRAQFALLFATVVVAVICLIILGYSPETSLKQHRKKEPMSHLLGQR